MTQKQSHNKDFGVASLLRSRFPNQTSAAFNEQLESLKTFLSVRNKYIYLMQVCVIQTNMKQYFFKLFLPER